MAKNRASKILVRVGAGSTQGRRRVDASLARTVWFPTPPGGRSIQRKQHNDRITSIVEQDDGKSFVNLLTREWSYWINVSRGGEVGGDGNRIAVVLTRPRS